MKKISFWLFVFVLWHSDLPAQTPYFQGKTIRLVVGYPAGSAHDIWARLIAPQLTKHIPGNPATIVQIMPGAGSMTAANYVYNIAKPDGLTIGVVNAALYFEQVQKRPEVQFRLVKIHLGGQLDAHDFSTLHVGQHSLQNHPRCPRRRRAAQVRRHRDGKYRLLFAKVA